MFSWFKKKPEEKQKYNVGRIDAEFIFSNGLTYKYFFLGKVETVYHTYYFYNNIVGARTVFERYLQHYQKTGYYKIVVDDQEKYIPISDCTEIKTVESNHIIEY